MLREREQEMLTAYVDGELASRQRDEVKELLRRSPEARRLLRRLQKDAEAVRALPRASLQVDFSRHVMQTIREKRLRPAAGIKTKTRPISRWTVIGAAATVLFAVGITSYFVVAAFRPYGTKTNSAQQQPSQANKGGSSEPAGNPGSKPPVHPLPKPPKDPDKGEQPKPGVHPPSGKSTDVAVKRGAHKPIRDLPNLKAKGGIYEDTLITGPSFDHLRPKLVDVALPTMLYLHGLGSKVAKAKLLDALQSYPATYVELRAKDANQAFVRLQSACRRQGIALTIGPLVKPQREKVKRAADYVFFLENLAPDQLAGFFELVYQEDLKAYNTKRSTAQLRDSQVNLIVTELVGDHRRRLKTITGSEMRPLADPPSTSKNAAVDVRRPLSEQTLEAVEAALSKGAKKNQAKGTALAMLYSTAWSRHNAPAVKRFLEQRLPMRKNAVQMMLVLRTK